MNHNAMLDDLDLMKHFCRFFKDAICKIATEFYWLIHKKILKATSGEEKKISGRTRFWQFSYQKHDGGLPKIFLCTY